MKKKKKIKTAVYDNHVALGGKMVDFAGYYLPVQYPAGVKEECMHTRQAASLFDVSHMGQVRVHGADAVKFVESVVVGDIAALKPGESQLSLITNAKGGIIDDTVITKESQSVAMVLNGACKAKDLVHMESVLSSSGLDAKIERLDHLSLFALQGPQSASALGSMLEGIDLSSMLFMSQSCAKIAGIDCTVTRCGYTGEDGFELSVANDKASDLMEALLSKSEVKPAGLGARDTLRIEAGLCLYGQDIDEATTPVEATLMWTIGKRRRQEGGFTGSDVIMDQFKSKSATKKRVGFSFEGRQPARTHTMLYAEQEGGDPIGEITSGTFSPVLGAPVAMGYIAKDLSKAGTQVFAQVRNKRIPAQVSKMPFVPANYFRG